MWLAEAAEAFLSERDASDRRRAAPVLAIADGGEDDAIADELLDAPAPEALVSWQGRSAVLFCGNDYLGVSAHPALRAYVGQAVLRHGMGPRGSPLVCGHTALHLSLAEALGELKGVSSPALLCPTGYAANLAVLGAVAGPRCAIFSDERNHASIVDGCRLARAQGAEVYVYPHLDVAALETLLGQSDRSQKLIVTESVFSMDGTLAPLAGLAELRRRHAAALMVDESHGNLVFGSRGGGLSEASGCASSVDVQVGTLSKAFGAQGGFITTASPEVRSFIENAGRSQIYSTALPVPVVAAARIALRLAHRGRLRAQLGATLRAFGDEVGKVYDGPIIPWILGADDRALKARDVLLEAGFFVQAIRPPTVAPGTARLRISLSAAHTPSQASDLARVLLRLSSQL